MKARAFPRPGPPGLRALGLVLNLQQPVDCSSGFPAVTLVAVEVCVSVLLPVWGGAVCPLT